MYGVFSDGEPFRVFARRENIGTQALVLKFECKAGMGILGLRKSGRADPIPAPAYEEEDIDPGSLRAGRFVHVLASGQRQSYALSRISNEVASRMPADRWVELKPHTEYGFRYLVAPEEELDSTTASVRVTAPPATRSNEIEEQAFDLVVPGSAPSNKEPSGPLPGATREATTRDAPIREARPSGRQREDPIPQKSSLPPAQAAMSPALADASLRLLTKEQAVEQLKTEMQKVHTLQQHVSELEQAVRRGRQREKDLLELLAKWEPR